MTRCKPQKCMFDPTKHILNKIRTYLEYFTMYEPSKSAVFSLQDCITVTYHELTRYRRLPLLGCHLIESGSLLTTSLGSTPVFFECRWYIPFGRSSPSQKYKKKRSNSRKIESVCYSLTSSSHFGMQMTVWAYFERPHEETGRPETTSIPGRPRFVNWAIRGLNETHSEKMLV